MAKKKLLGGPDQKEWSTQSKPWTGADAPAEAKPKKKAPAKKKSSKK